MPVKLIKEGKVKRDRLYDFGTVSLVIGFVLDMLDITSASPSRVPKGKPVPAPEVKREVLSTNQLEKVNTPWVSVTNAPSLNMQKLNNDLHHQGR